MHLIRQPSRCAQALKKLEQSLRRSDQLHVQSFSQCMFGSKQNPDPAMLAIMSPRNNQFGFVPIGAVAFVVTFVILPSAVSTHCDDTSNENPLWPAGVSSQDVDDFVDDILKDPSFNISTIPDYMEQIIYTSTVRLTLNMVYSALSQLHGLHLLAHKFQLRRYEELPTEVMEHEHKHTRLQRGSVRIDDKVLEEVAARLLANKAVNQTFIPDFVERQLYVNCLKLVFRVLDSIAATFRITVCGHDMRLRFEPTSISNIDRDVLINAAASSVTKVDIEAVKNFARQAGVHDNKNITNRGFFRQRWDLTCDECITQLHASVYALILGIVDDLLANTELEVLSDRIRMDIVPIENSVPFKPSKPVEGKTEQDTKTTRSVKSTHFLLPFAAGVGAGALMMSLVARR